MLIVFHVQLDILHMGACASTSGAILFLFDCGLRGAFEERTDVVWSALRRPTVSLAQLQACLSEVLFTCMFEGCGRS